MNVHISYKVPKSAALEKEINHHIEKLNRRVQLFRPELVHLHGIVEENSAREGFCISLNLRLPSGQVAARECAHTAASCTKAVFNHLIEEVTRHKERLRHEHAWVRRQREGRGRPPAQVPFEKTLAAVHPVGASDGDITNYINANLHRLDRFVDRELRYRRNIGTLSDRNITREDVVDEVIVTALGDDLEKPQVLGLEAWLYRLAIRAIDVVARRDHEQAPTLPLEQSTRKRNERASDEPQLQFHQPDEMFTREDITPDRRLSNPEEIASSEEMIDQVEAALLSAKREDRDAFILYAVEGFTVAEISAISDRTPDQARTSIVAAREFLKKTVTMPNEFKDKLLQHSRIA
jgi:RNA polymerase sigma factor (sigma-70 family)